MVRRIESLEELIMDLNQIKSSYNHENIGMNEMKKQYNEFENAKIFIQRNKELNNHHPLILQQNQIILHNTDYHAKYTKIINLERKINQIRQQNQPTDRLVFGYVEPFVFEY